MIVDEAGSVGEVLSQGFTPAFLRPPFRHFKINCDSPAVDVVEQLEQYRTAMCELDPGLRPALEAIDLSIAALAV
jgi:hypothetical protein